MLNKEKDTLNTQQKVEEWTRRKKMKKDKVSITKFSIYKLRKV